MEFDDVYDIANFSDFGDEVELPVTEDRTVTDPAAYYAKSAQYWMQIPIPEGYIPTGGAPLAGLDDETLLTMSPALIIHAQRTAASGGLQVVSPRAIPLAMSAAHTAHAKRTTDMFIAGSVASRNMDWPVLRDPVPAHLFANEPIDGYPSVPTVRPPSKTMGIAAAARGVSDPVVRAFLTGRALVDLQRRTDVAGSGDALAAHIAASWGLPQDIYDGMAEASLAPMGSLLRYATRADTAYPVLNAPIHARKCISVGANTAGRLLYGEHAAIDWRRLRVLCEAVFYMSSRIEGHSLVEMALQQPPGDPRADPLRAGVLQMRPLPGSVWTHDPATFRLDIQRTDPPPAAIEYPERIAAAVADFYAEARPVAIAAWDDGGGHLVPTISQAPRTVTREAVIVGYHRTMQLASDFSARGRTSAAAVRDYLYQCLSGNTQLSAVRTLWMTRYLRETAVACAMSAHLDTVLTRQLASRLSDFITDMRVRLAVESNRRGATLDEWWDDIRALLPGELSSLSEGSASWSIAIAHFLLHPYSSKWAGLTHALGSASHAAMASGVLQTVRLPARIGSPMRVYEAAAATARALGASYGAYYSSMYEVGCILAAQMKRMGNSVAAYKLRVAAGMWDIRAKVASSVELHTDDGTATEAGTIPCATGPYHLTTAPYPAYTRWRELLHTGRIVSMAARREYPHHLDGPVERAFLGKREALFPMGAQANARLFRYTTKPARLAEDISETLTHILHDVTAVVARYEHEEAAVDIAWGEPTVLESAVPREHFSLTAMRPPADDYWTCIAGLEQEDAIDTEDLLLSLPQEVQDMVMARSYTSALEAREYVVECSLAATAARDAGRDVVV